MSTKPTAGPFDIVLHEGDLTRGFEVKNTDGIVAIFPIEDGWGLFAAKSNDEAKANARAWVDGIAAMEKLERIRSVFLEMPDASLRAIAHILNEAKP